LHRPRATRARKPRFGKLVRLLEILRVIRLGSLRDRLLGRRLFTLLNLLVGGSGQLERCDQLLGLDRVGQRLKNIERPQPPTQQLQPLAVGSENPQHRGPFLRDRPQQLETRAVFQPFGGYDDLERVRTQQVEAVAFVGYTVDSVKIPERSGDRQVAGGILVDNEHTHAAMLPDAFP